MIDKCPNCKHHCQLGPYDDVATCPKCGSEFLTAMEKQLRSIVEFDHSKKMQYPKVAVARAIAYASAIYGMATHDEQFDCIKVEDRLRKQFKDDLYNQGGTGDVDLVHSGWEGRGLRLRNLNDPRTGFMIITVTADRAARSRGMNFAHIYVVFRGSRSDGKDKNPMLAGFTEDLSQNVDYAANFTGRQDTPWWCTGVKIRRGFLELYKSMSNDIVLELNTQLGKYPNAQVIVTGHSLGAALAVVCAHHLQYHRGKQMEAGGPFCYPFCTPRVGNIHFARDFKTRLGSSECRMPGEPGTQHYNRSINFVMSNDPVSTKAQHGYKHDRSDDLRGKGTPSANKSFGGKIVYGLTKKTNNKIIFYQTPNLYKLGNFALWNIHQYSKLQEIFLGKTLFKT